ncbi:hypothetical protein [Spirosoma sp. KNUC1025]|uniref:hypothetical protein n=1 Tax=Spirosoma sp. KNUC1025 TaxID=2894082 RepID=UPI003870C331|nr:hypothetical protein LN737_19930 [Spirosoma sp. KNUC1025]
MATKLSGNRTNQPVYVLVIEDNTDQQDLIANCLQAPIDQTRVIFASTADEALNILSTSAMEYYNFPEAARTQPGCTA